MVFLSLLKLKNVVDGEDALILKFYFNLIYKLVLSRYLIIFLLESNKLSFELDVLFDIEDSTDSMPLSDDAVML